MSAMHHYQASIFGCVALAWLAACRSHDPPARDSRGPEATTWSFAELGPGRCVAVNARGQVLGIDDTDVGFVVDGSGVRSSLGGLAGGGRAVGVAISPGGVVVGYTIGDER